MTTQTVRSLVIGGAGLVGSHLVDRLLARGHEVIAVDDLSRGSYANLAHLKGRARFAFVEHDVNAPFGAQVDRVYYLALPLGRRGRGEAAATCVRGTVHALEAACASGARFLLASGAERAGHGARCAESLASEYRVARGLDVRVARYPSAFGPRMAPDLEQLVSALVLQALRGDDLTPHAPLEQRVRVSFVGDVVETLVCAMEGSEPPPVVLAPSFELSVLELARTIACAAGASDAPIRATTSPDGPVSVPRSARLEALPASLALGLRPTASLTEALTRTTAWFGARMGIRVTDRPSGIYAGGAAESDRRIA